MRLPAGHWQDAGVLCPCSSYRTSGSPWGCRATEQQLAEVLQQLTAEMQQLRTSADGQRQEMRQLLEATDLKLKVLSSNVESITRATVANAESFARISIAMQGARPDGAVHLGGQACRAGLEVSRGLCNAAPVCLMSSCACNCLGLLSPCTRSADACHTCLQPLALFQYQALPVPEQCAMLCPCPPCSARSEEELVDPDSAERPADLDA